MGRLSLSPQTSPTPHTGRPLTYTQAQALRFWLNEGLIKAYTHYPQVLLLTQLFNKNLRYTN